MAIQDKCGICDSINLKKVLKTKQLPISTRYKKNPTEKEFLKHIELNSCLDCGVFQIGNPIDYKKLVPIYDWISYNEPEDHLDDACRIIKESVSSIEDLCVGGLTYKDDSTLNRLQNLGFKNIWRIDPLKDLEITNRMHNIESIQEKIGANKVNELIDRYGLADVLLVRHIFEHTHHTREFTDSLTRLVKSQGLVIFEVPDCEAAIKSLDYTTLWEEHRYYFTSETFSKSLEILGFEIIDFKCYEYPHENSLVAFTRASGVNKKLNLNTLSRNNHLKDVEIFVKEISSQQEILKQKLKKFKQRKSNIAIFGGGHLSCMFMNIMDCTGYIRCVVDDDPLKQNLYMPGTEIKILGSNSLNDQDIGLCLMAVSPSSEKAIIENNKEFTERGGIFTSIFPQNENNIFNIHI